MKKYLINIIGLVLITNCNAQITDIDSVLSMVARNNPNLKLRQAQIESEKLKLRVGNNFNDPVVSAFYMPFAAHTDVVYTEYQIDQTFEFPTIYKNRKALNELKEKELELQYQQMKQDILTKAKTHCFSIIYNNKKLGFVQQELENAQRAFTVFENETTNSREKQRANLYVLEKQFELEEINNELNNLQISLSRLNGGKPINFIRKDYLDTNDTTQFDKLWERKKALDPYLKKLRQKEVTSSQNLDLVKSEKLPDLIIGYNSQGTPGNNFGGIYGGLSLPLWSNKNTLQLAKNELHVVSFTTNIESLAVQTQFKKKYNSYKAMLKNYRAYLNATKNIENHNIIIEFENGEASFDELKAEWAFSKDINFKRFEMEYKLKVLKTELNSFELLQN